MGDSKGPVDKGPSLELPSLFRRRKDVAPEPAVEPVAEPVVTPAHEVAEDRAAGGATAAPVDDDPTVVEPEVAPGPSDHEQTQVIERPADADRPTRGATAVGATGAKRVRPIEPRTTEPSERGTPGVPVGERVRAAVPEMAPGALAAVVGAIVGLAGCVFTWLGLQGCEVVTGAQTCGGPGLLVLGAIVVGQVLLGAALLKMLRVPEPGNLSFLGVGIMVVVALLLLTDYLYEAWMFAAIPVVTALAFAVARWVTTKYTDDADDYPVEQHDIR